MLKNLLKEQHYHHWVGKGIWTVLVFAVVTLLSYFMVRKKTFSNNQLATWLTVLSWVVILGALILFAFFGYEYTTHH